MDSIGVHQRPEEATRSAGKSCKWVAEAIVHGRSYTATSRMAPANDIARQLVGDGVADAPMRAYSTGLKGCLTWPSLHKAAEFTIEENAQAPVRRKRWVDPAMANFPGTKPPKQGVNAPAGSPVAPEPSTSQIDVFGHG